MSNWPAATDMTPGKSAEEVQRDADKLVAESELAARDEPQHVEERKAVIRAFHEVHFPDLHPDHVEEYIDTVNLSRPVMVVNASDEAAVTNTSLFGGSKPRLLKSGRFPPQKAEDPVYALLNYPLQ